MNNTKSAGISVEVSLNSGRVIPPAHHIRHPYKNVTSRVFNNVILNQHICRLTRPWAAVMRVTYIAPCMLQLHPTNRNAGYCCTGSAGMSVQVTSGQWPSVHVCSTFSQPTAQASLPQGQLAYSALHMFNYVALDQHI